MVDHLSYSQISTYLQCQRNYRYKYVDLMETPDNDALLFGSVWHKMISLVVGGGYGLASGLAKAYMETIGGDSHRDPIFELGRNMINSPHVAKTLEGLRPCVGSRLCGYIGTQEYRKEHTFVDHYIEFTIPQIPVPIIGYIDMIASDGVPVDFKTASRKWTQQKADVDLQPTFYLAGLHAQGFLKASDFPAKFRYIIFLKKPPYEVQVIETTRTAKDVINLFGLVESCYKAMVHEVYLPTGAGSWKCSPNYCDFYRLCVGGTRDGI